MKQKGDNDLPRLAYVGDVNVQNYCLGSLQLFRLLADCSPENLLVVETTLNCSPPELRLPEVPFLHHRPPWARLFFQSRFPGLAPWLANLAVARWWEIGRILRSFKPEALLTVAHGFSWLAVSELARRWKIPLHLIVHDDWPRHPSFSQAVSRKLDVIFGDHYRAAASRMCVSPFMEEVYHRAHHVQGDVLYPTRFADLAIASEPPPRLAHELKNLTLGFAGTLHAGQVAPMRHMAEVLHAQQGRLLIFGPTTQADLHHAGLTNPNIEVRGMVPTPRALIETMRAETDVLYAPAPFEEEWRGNAALGFPSKLADYTAAAMPMFIHGPPWCSAVRWALQEPGSALVVDSDDSTSLAGALAQLQGDSHLRLRLADGAVKTGEKYFSLQAAATLFRHCLEQRAAV